MLFAAIGAINGNWPALEAVLHAIGEEGIQTIVNTGNSAVGQAWPNEVIQGLRSRNIPSVQGQEDRLALRVNRKANSLQSRLDPDRFQALKFTYDTCKSENLEYLRTLPRTLTLSVDGIGIAVFHGTWTSQGEGLVADESDTRFRRQREVCPEPILICGSTLVPFARTVDGTLFVNPGSVGANPGRAHYALVSTEKEPWSAEFRSVDYDV